MRSSNYSSPSFAFQRNGERKGPIAKQWEGEGPRRCNILDIRSCWTGCSTANACASFTAAPLIPNLLPFAETRMGEGISGDDISIPLCLPSP